MINRFTKIKMNDTFLASKDGKGYIFDIRRPSMKKNKEIYTQEKEATIILPGRTGLGNRVLRRVNFIKPDIQARKVGEGRMRPPIKSLQEMIKAGIKIKYEEPDPWDTEWINKKNEIIATLKDPGYPGGAQTEAQIDVYLKKYPPLNRSQRTRPVNKDPFEDANKPIADQLKVMGQNVIDVTTAVTKNSADALQNSVNQMTENNRLALWTGGEIAKVEAIINQLNLDSDTGRNMLGAKLDEIVKNVTLQAALTNTILMNSVQKLTISKDIIKILNYEQLINTPGANLAIMSLFKTYNINPSDDIFEVYNVFGVLEKTLLNFYEALREMSVTNDFVLINDSINIPNKIFFRRYATGVAISTTLEISDKQTELLKLGFDTELDVNNVVLHTPDAVLPLVDPLEEKKETPEERKDNINKTIPIIQAGLMTCAEEGDKTKDAYMKWLNEYGPPNINKKYPNTFKRVLKININYLYKLNPNNNKYENYNPNFLNVKIFTAGTNSLAPYTRNKELFDYTYDEVNDPEYVYFIWSSLFDLYKGSISKYEKFKLFLEKYLTDEYNKIHSNEALSKANLSSDVAYQASIDAQVYADRANEALKKLDEDKKDDLMSLEELEDKNNKIQREKEFRENYVHIITSLNTIFHNAMTAEGVNKLTPKSKEKLQAIMDKYIENINKYITTKNIDKLAFNRTLKQIQDNLFKNNMMIRPYITNMEIKAIIDGLPYKGDPGPSGTEGYVDYDSNPSFMQAGFGYKNKKNNKSLLYKMKKTKGTGLTLPGGAKVNPWLVHVKAFRAKNPTMKYSEVLKKAKDTYKK